MQYSAVWLNESGSIYVDTLQLLKSTDFESQTKNFNLILNSFKSSIINFFLFFSKIILIQNFNL